MKNLTLLFDLDGTLIDSTTSILAGFREAFLKFDVEYPGDKVVKDLIGYPLDYMFEKMGISINEVPNFIDAYKAKYREIYLDQTSLKFDAKEALKIASEFANLGVVTTKTSKYSQILLEHLGIAKFFGVIIGRDDVKEPKPAAEPINLALKRLGVNLKSVGNRKILDKFAGDVVSKSSFDNNLNLSEKQSSTSNFNMANERIFMIGDTKLDALAAKNANIKSLGVRYGYGDEAQLLEHFDAVFDNVSQAVTYAKKFL